MSGKQFILSTVALLLTLVLSRESYAFAAEYDSSLQSRSQRGRSVPEGDNHRRWATLRSGDSYVGVGDATSVSNSTNQEVEALLSFKATIAQDPLGVLRSWNANDSSACSWTGVQCSSQSHRVTALNLVGRRMVGNINSALLALGRLQFLQQLDLSVNNFTGSLSGTALANWTSLLYLNASGNYVSGPIPYQVGELVSLQILDLEQNNLTGEIPVSILNCSSLEVLNLQTNFLEGGIPKSIGRLSNLLILKLGNAAAASIIYSTTVVGNDFSGSIPPSLGNCSSLTELVLHNNERLTGEIPPSLSQLTKLQHVSIGYCSFSGVLSPWLTNFTNLNYFYAAYNQLCGEIPDTIGQLWKLSGFIINDNNITGVVPESIMNCTFMTTLGLEENVMLRGHLPSGLGQLSSLQTVTIWANSVTGIIPTSLSNCTNLEYLAISNQPMMDPQPFPAWVVSCLNLWGLYVDRVKLYGAIPNDIGRLSNLEELVTYSNNLTGQLPSTLANCTFLTYFESDANQHTGSIPSELGLLGNLQYVDLSYNSLSGSLPATITNLSQLTHLDLGYNTFTGTIDSYDWGSLSQLGDIYLNNNHFTGPVPEKFRNSSSLFLLSLSANRLSGEIPTSYGNMTALEQLSLSNNQISGIVPPDLARCQKLGTLDLRMNKLTGYIPSNIGEFSALQNLSLGSNKLSGSVPRSLGNCSILVTLDLSSNGFTGSMPAGSISKIVPLTFLNLSHNQFSGIWSPQLSSLQTIQSIDVSANNITGEITSPGLSAWTVLRTLDISNNNFTGDIPPALGSLPELNFFNASYNNFHGSIPSTGFFRFNITEDSFLGNPGLCGSILGPGRECRNQTSSSHARSCKSLKCRAIWIPILCASAVSVVVSLLFWICVLGKARHKEDPELMLNFVSGLKLSSSQVQKIINGGYENRIGAGAKSAVYKGSFVGSTSCDFAVKTIHSYGDEEEDSLRELEREVHILAKLRHRNILKVFGFFSTSEVKAIILEYMPEGCLHRHIYEFGTGMCKLPWLTRFNVAVGVAEGMKYLHHDFPEPLIHGDLKPTNILLDASFEAKVADFGLSKFVHRIKDSQGEASASTVRGTFGYVPPEYALGTSVSTKGDVYSYGVLLLEMLTGVPPSSSSNWESNHGSRFFGASVNIAYRKWALKLFCESPSELLDVTLNRESATDPQIKEKIKLTLLVALFCSREKPQSRPSMSDVVSMLVQIKHLGSKCFTSTISSTKIAEILDQQSCSVNDNSWNKTDPNSEDLPPVSNTGSLD